MNIIHAAITFRDAFSGCIAVRIKTVSEETFEKMKAGIGSSFQQFDKVAQIRYTWVVEKVEQATEPDYIKANVKNYTNKP